MAWYTFDPRLFKTEVLVLQLWLESTGHRDNMLNSEWREIGVGCYIEPRRIQGRDAAYVFCAAEFGTPSTSPQ